MDPVPVTLEGQWVRLEPLEGAHAPDLLAAAATPEIWRYFTWDPSRDLATMQAWIEAACRAQAAGTDLPFAIRERAGGRVIGSTRYMDIRSAHRGLEIGTTWLDRSYWRTAVNSECKFLLLRHAFETLGAIRVQLKTDLRNTISQRAIERLGAVREGVLRKHMVMPDGYLRSTVMYSITDDEWPLVKARLARGLYE